MNFKSSLTLPFAHFYNIMQCRCDIEHCLEILKRDYGIRSVLIEGGAAVIQTVLEKKLAHQMVLTLRPCFLGGFRCLTHQLSSLVKLKQVQMASVGGDIILHGLLEKYSCESVECGEPTIPFDQHHRKSGTSSNTQLDCDWQCDREKERVTFISDDL